MGPYIQTDRHWLELNAFHATLTSEESDVEDLFDNVETACDWEGAELEAEGLEDSAVSLLGRTPSANHTLLWSRETEPRRQHPVY